MLLKQYSHLKFFLAGLLLIFAGLGFFYERDVAGRLAWEYLRVPGLSLAISNDDRDLKHTIASYYFNGGVYDLGKARALYVELVEVDPADKIALYQLARIYFVQGNTFEALRLLDRNLELYPEWKQSHYIRGLVNVYRGNFAEAAQDFEAFIAWKPEGWGAYNDLAWAYLKAAKYNEAWEAAARGLENSPNNMWLNNTAGVALWNSGDLVEAENRLLVAQEQSQLMSVERWRSAYLGNDPATYEASLEAMRAAIQRNLDGVRAERVQEEGN